MRATSKTFCLRTHQDIAQKWCALCSTSCKHWGTISDNSWNCLKPLFPYRISYINCFGWARIECEESGAVNYGLPMKVRPVYRDDEYLWGFITSIMSRDGANLTDIRVMWVHLFEANWNQNQAKCLKVAKDMVKGIRSKPFTFLPLDLIPRGQSHYYKIICLPFMSERHSILAGLTKRSQRSTSGWAEEQMASLAWRAIHKISLEMSSSSGELLSVIMLNSCLFAYTVLQDQFQYINESISDAQNSFCKKACCSS